MNTHTARRLNWLPVILAALIVVAWVTASGVIHARQASTPDLPACATEDSDNCYWDADTMGNREGRSFTVINGVVTYLP